MNRATKLNKQVILYLEPKIPFNFRGTFIKPSHFPSKIVLFGKDRIFQSIEIGGNLFGLEIFDCQPKIGINVFSKGRISEKTKDIIGREIAFRYNVDGDVSEFLKKFQQDELLSGPISRWAGMRPSIAYSLYGFLMVATVLQNATVKRTVQMMDALLQKYGKKLIFAGVELYAMWTPGEMDSVLEEDLRALKIGYRAKNIKRISQFFVSNPNAEQFFRGIQDREDLKKSLLKIYGVGPQSVSYLLFEAFHFYDSLDHLSPWEGKIVSMLLYGNKEADPKSTLADVDRRWGSWKMLAIHYIFEDLFWRRKTEKIPWLEEEIRM
jgi:3-methyladenine DNA glycosylase/8-oxoguanine DNA glycosylase